MGQKENVRLGDARDIDSWMELVTLVRWNFPGLETPELMEGHRQTVLWFMERGEALCVKDGQRVVGVMLFSRKHNMICCLAVAPECRRKGIGAALLAEALERLDRTGNITVTTFRANDEKGTAPRALYRKFGFKEGEMTVENDYPVQEFVLRPERQEVRR